MFGALIAAGASLLGGHLNRKAQEKRDRKAHEFERTRIRTVAADAKAAGIHPLAALGAASGYQNPYGGPVSGSTMGDGFAAAGQYIGDAIDKRGQKKQAATLNEKQIDLVDAQIIESRSRTLLNQANAKRALVGPQAPHDPYAIRKENALIKVKLENGTEVYMPNPDVYEVSPAEMVTARALMEASRVGKKVSEAKVDWKKKSQDLKRRKSLITRSPKHRRKFNQAFGN